jgi:hypothetical protein
MEEQATRQLRSALDKSTKVVFAMPHDLKETGLV